MTSTELLNLQIEFETSPISINELCDKYSVTKKQLKGYTKWKKRIDTTILPPAPKPNTDIVTAEIVETDKLLADIALFKEKAVDYALSKISDTQYLEVKEFRDLVSVVDTVEKSLKDKDETNETTVNVMINNIMKGLKDDC